MAPKTFRCGGCDKMLSENRYSSTALRRHRQAVAYKGSGQRGNWQRRGAPRSEAGEDPETIPRPLCMGCTNTNVYELECRDCGTTMSLEHFSKAQRRNPDNALCNNCSQDRQDLEPEHADQVQEEIAMDRIRNGISGISMGTGTSGFGYSAHSRTMGASTNGASDWMQAQIPIPEDPRARSGHGSTRTHSPSNVSHRTYQSNASAVAGTGWENFERTNAPYREQNMAQRRSSNSNSSSSRFARQEGKPRPDVETRALNSYARQQARQQQQEEQAELKEDTDDDSSDDEPPY